MTVSGLRDRLAGPVLLPGDDGYDDARRLHNAAVEHHPAAVVRVSGPGDVAATLRFAREQGLSVSVRGGGHGVVGHATAGDVVIDLSRLRSVAVDPQRRLARVGGGATWGELDGATQAHGLATPGGRVTHTGVAGLTLGGGQGWLSPAYGLSCDNLVGAEVVTADGRIVVVDGETEPELLWGLRGGGGNFGVVTAFRFQLHPVGPIVLGGLLFYPIERAGEVAARYAAFTAAAPPEVGGALILSHAPPAPFVPPDLVGAPVVGLVLCWFGADAAAGERALAPMRTAIPPIVDLVGPMPYTAVQSMTDEGSPPGWRNYWSGTYLTDLAPAVLDAAVDAMVTGLPPLSIVVLAPMGVAVNAVAENATAFPHREARWLLHPMAVYADPADDGRARDWARGLAAAGGAGAGAGTYLNVESEAALPNRVRAAYSADSYARLVRLKRAWDPDNVFRHTANIAAAGGGQRAEG